MERATIRSICKCWGRSAAKIRSMRPISPPTSIYSWMPVDLISRPTPQLATLSKTCSSNPSTRPSKYMRALFATIPRRCTSGILIWTSCRTISSIWVMTRMTRSRQYSRERSQMWESIWKLHPFGEAISTLRRHCKIWASLSFCVMWLFRHHYLTTILSSKSKYCCSKNYLLDSC